jgi:hypothetical protein
MDDFDTILNRISLANSVDLLTIYNGLTPQNEIAETVALQSILNFTNVIPNNQIRPPEYLSNIVKDLTLTNNGAFSTIKLIKRIKDQIDGATSAQIEELGRFIKIFYNNLITIMSRKN